MKLTKVGQIVTIAINDTESVVFREKDNESKIVQGCVGSIAGNSFRYVGRFPKKYGRGKFANESLFYGRLERVEWYLKQQGYTLIR